MSEVRTIVESGEELLGGASDASRRLLGQLDRVARTPRTTVLLRGAHPFEALLTARAIHARTARSATDSLFRVVTCQGRLPGTAGSDDLSGLLDATPCGTLFLADVSRLQLETQRELLAALEAAAAGTRRDLPRVIASTPRNLEAQVDAGQFLEELLYRLNVLVIRVPTLAERREDLETLVPRVLGILGRRLGVPLRAGPGLAVSFKGWGLPGGLLELEATLAAAAARALNATPATLQVGPEHLPMPRRADGDALVPAPASSRNLRELEEATIRRVLEEEGGNRSRAARLLGINRATLYNKLKLYGIS